MFWNETCRPGIWFSLRRCVTVKCCRVIISNRRGFTSYRLIRWDRTSIVSRQSVFLWCVGQHSLWYVYECDVIWYILAGQESRSRIDRRQRLKNINWPDLDPTNLHVSATVLGEQRPSVYHCTVSPHALGLAGRGEMRVDVEYSPVGEGLGMSEFWLHVWMRRVAVIAAHVIAFGLTVLISLLSRPGTSEYPKCLSLLIVLASYNSNLLPYWHDILTFLQHKTSKPGELVGFDPHQHESTSNIDQVSVDQLSDV